MTADFTAEGVTVRGGDDLTESELDELREAAIDLAGHLIDTAHREAEVGLDVPDDFETEELHRPVQLYLSSLEPPRVLLPLAHDVADGRVCTVSDRRRYTVDGTTVSMDGTLEPYERLLSPSRGTH